MQREAGEILHSGNLHKPVDQDVPGGKTRSKRFWMSNILMVFHIFIFQIPTLFQRVLMKHWTVTLQNIRTTWKDVVVILFPRTSWCHLCLAWWQPDCSVVRQDEQNWTAETLNQSRPLIPDLMDSHSCKLWPGRAELGWKHMEKQLPKDLLNHIMIKGQRLRIIL